MHALCYLAGFEDSPGLAVLSGRLQGDVTLGVPVKHPEEVVVGAGHDHTGDQKDMVVERNGGLSGSGLGG